MKRLLFYVFCIVISMQSCSQDGDFLDGQSTLNEDEIEVEKISFPEHIEAYGKAVARELGITVRKLNEENVDYSEIGKSEDFREKFRRDWFAANPTMVKTRALEVSQPTIMSPDEFMERYNALTEIQLRFIHKIINECEKSASYQILLAKLVDINEEIHAQVPEIEQERLINVISVLYFGVQEILSLEGQGQMLRTPYDDIRTSKIKTREWENDGSVAAGCTKFLTTVWTIAVGEPTPIGEIVASVATVVVGAVLMYEVVTCRKPNVGSLCDDMYKLCSENDKKNNAPNSGGWGRTMCYECYHYCLAQKVWDCPRPKF